MQNLGLKKVGKTTRSFRYDLYQIPHEYRVEVMTISKGFDLVDRVPENYGWRLITLYRRQSPKASPRKGNARR